MPQKEETYEIVPIDPLSRIEKKSENLEKEISDIKSALRGTVGLSKLEENADEFITQMLNLLKASQKMVEEVAASNQQVAGKIQEALDRMNATNEEMSEKMGKILDFFAQATEAMEGGEDTGSIENVSKTISSSMGDLKKSIDSMVTQNEKTHGLLESIGKDLKKQTMRPRAPAPMPQQRYPPQGGGMMPPPNSGMPAPPPQPGGRQGSGELPPPPFPP